MWMGRAPAGPVPAVFEWDTVHAEGPFRQVPSESLMLTGDENLVETYGVVQYAVADPARFLFAIREPEELVRVTAERTLRFTVAAHSLDAVLTSGRPEIEAAWHEELSNALAGSQEYMAMEKLFEIHQEERYDLLVLDTPPSRDALDFLEAPKRLTQFIEGRSLQLFMKPTGLGMRLFGVGTSMMFSILRRVTGINLLEDIAEFFQAFSGMVGGFQERAKRVNELLADPASCFLVVCGPQGEPVTEAVYFHRKLVEAQLPFGAVIVNKVHFECEPAASGEALRAELTELLEDEDLATRVATNYEDYSALAARDRRNIDRLTSEMGARRVIRVPYLDDEIHDLAGLMTINRYLFATGSEREALAAGVASA